MKSIKLILFIFFLIIILLIKGYYFSHKYNSDDKEKEYVLFVTSLNNVRDDKVSYNVKLSQESNESYCFRDSFILNIFEDSHSKEKIDLDKYKLYKYGDVIKVKGKITIPEYLNNPGEFNYKRYLHSNNIYGTINTYKDIYIEEYLPNPLEKIFSYIYSFKGNISTLIDNSMQDDNANIAKAMIYGDKTGLDESVKLDFEHIGVSHLMTVSGSNISSFIIVFSMFFRKKENNKTKYIVTIIFVVVFIIFNNFSISILRAGIMIIIVSIFKLLNKKETFFLPMLITFILILLNSPYAIYNTGMKLSFLAVLGIKLFKENIQKKLNKSNSNNKLLRIVKKMFANNFAVTISVQLMILPIEISVFYSIPFPLILSNLLMNLLVIPISIMGTIGIFLSFFEPVATIIFSFMEFFIILLIKLVNILKSISIQLSTRSMPSIIYFIYYIWVICIYYSLNIKNKYKDSSKCRVNLKKIAIVRRSAFIVFCLLYLTISVYKEYFANYVYFFNVGQGDMSYMQVGKENVIVDSGSLSNNVAFNIIDGFLTSENITKIEYLVVSHMHTDHINGIEKLLANYKVKFVVYAKPPEEDENYTIFKEWLNATNTNSIIVDKGDKLNLKKIKIEILLPNKGYIKTKDMLNTNSLVCKICCKHTNLLYMGDATKEAEEELLKGNIGKIDILKVGHHGSKTASSLEFIQNISAKYAIISSKRKYYGHPHESVLEILNQNNVSTYTTETNGAIKFYLE